MGGGLQSRPDIDAVQSGDRPAPRSGNLPAELTTFVGRTTELAALAGRFDASRLVTITGPPGVGKSRLAVHLAHDLAWHRAQGGWLIELSSLSDPDRVPELAARVLGLRGERGRDVSDLLVDRLASWDGLLLIDNCEHLLLAVGKLTQLLLTRCSTLRILATSRERLRLGGETVWPLEPLPNADAVALFIDRARAVSPRFDVKPELIAAICQRLEGIPLGIELAAARAEAMSLETIEERLRDRLRLLTRGDRTAHARQQTLRGALEWSHALLDESQRRAFRRTAVFVDGFDLEAAEAVCADVGQPGSKVDEQLVALVDKSMVGRDGRRYRLLDTMREFAVQRLLEAEETESMRRTHASHFAALAERAAAARAGGDETWWVDRLWADRANLVAALDWACANDPEAAARLAYGLSLMWWVRGDDGAASGCLEKAVAAPSNDRVLRGFVLLEAAIFAETFGELERARDYYATALGIAMQVDHPRLLARCLEFAGWFLVQEGGVAEGRACLIEGLRISRDISRPGLSASLLARLGIIAVTADGDLAAARGHLTEAVDLCRQAGWERGLPMGLTLLGSVAMLSGDDRLAADCLRESVEVCRRNEEHRFAPYALDLAAALADRRSAFVRTLTLRAAAAGMRTRLGVPRDAGLFALVMAESLKTAERSLTASAAAAAAAAGRAMDFEQALDYAGQMSRATVTAKRLTRRELEIASFVAEGLSAKQIAIRLCLSERTVESHLERIREKLDVHTRSQIATWVAQEHWLRN